MLVQLLPGLGHGFMEGSFVLRLHCKLPFQDFENVEIGKYHRS
jgi:hypothetical protein